MPEDSEDDESEGKHVSETAETVFGTSASATESITIDFNAWIRQLKSDAEEALLIWEEGSDISSPKSEDVIVFFIIASTQIEEISARILHKDGHGGLLGQITGTSIGGSLEDFRDAKQYHREVTLESRYRESRRTRIS